MRIFAGRSWDALWDTEPQFRRIWRVSSVMWGVGLLVDAVVRMAMSYTLPIHAVPGLNGALYPVTFVVLQLVTVYSKPLLSPELAASAPAALDQLQRKPSRRNPRSRGGGSR